MMKAYGTDMDTFAWLQDLGYGRHFNDHMGGRRLGRVPWMVESSYPVKERLISGANTSTEAPFLVDIGGSTGHDLTEFRRHHPHVPGRLILQDLPAVIAQIEDLDPEIVRMEHDFFEEQPVKGKAPDAPSRRTGSDLRRCSCLLRAFHPKQLPRRHLREDTWANQERHEAWI